MKLKGFLGHRLEAAELVALELLTSSDALEANATRTAALFAAAASRTRGEWPEVLALARARLADRTDDVALADALWRDAVAACGRRPGCSVALTTAAARRGARAREAPVGDGVFAAEARAARFGAGGWRPWAEATASFCEIDRRSDLSRAEFHERYADGGRPVVVPFERNGSWTRSDLARRFGAVLVEPLRVARNWKTARLEPARHQGPTAVPLRRFLDDWPRDGPLWTDANAFGGRDFAAVVGDATPGALFDDPSRFSFSKARRQHFQTVFLGVRGSETVWHHHVNAYNLLLFGAKLWAFLPPLVGVEKRGLRGRDTGALGGPDALLDLIRQRPTELAPLFPEVGETEAQTPRRTRTSPLATPRLCVQRAGEMVFVPSGWQHMVLTLADSVGYVDRVGDRPDLTEYNQKVRRACPDGASPPAEEQRQTGAGSIPAEGCSKRVRGSSGA